MSDGEANVWQPRTLIEISGDTKSVEERITAIANQALFTLKDFAYVVGTGALELHKNGLLLRKNIDWIEQTGTTFSLLIAAAAGDQLVATGHVAITGTVDVRDTDIFVSNYQSIRDYVGTEISLYVQGTVTLADGGEAFFNKKTGDAPGTHVDDNLSVIVPTGGDGSIGWIAEVAGTYIPEGIGAVAAKAQEKLRSISRTPEDYKLISDPDDTLSFARMAAAGTRFQTKEDTTYVINSQIAFPKNNIDFDMSNSKFIIGGPALSTGFFFGALATDSIPVFGGLKLRGGFFFNADGTEVVDRHYILLAGMENFEINNVSMSEVSNGGILLRSGCKDGLIERIIIDSKSASGVVRGIWLNASDADDYQDFLVDLSSITRNANPVPIGGIRNVTIRKCEISMNSYNIYLMNAQHTIIDDCDLDIIDSAFRNVTINTYSPYTKLLDSRLTSASTTGNKGVLITQFSHGVKIKGNTFKGDWGLAQIIHPTFLAEVDIIENDFITPNAVPIEAEMGATGRVLNNVFSVPVEAAKTAGDRCMRIRTIGNFEATQSGFGDTATVLKGWEFRGNRVNKRNAGVQVTQQAALDNGNEVGMEAVIVRNNDFYDWGDISNSIEFPLFIASLPAPANNIHYIVEGNVTIPFNSGFEGRNRVEDPVGTAIELNSQSQTSGRGTWTIVLEDPSDNPAVLSTNIGRWTRNGNTCTFQGFFVVSSIAGMTGSAGVELKGLPFKAKNVINALWPFAVGFAVGLNIAAGQNVVGYILNNTTEGRLRTWDLTTGTSVLTVDELTAAGSLAFSGSYEIEDIEELN